MSEIVIIPDVHGRRFWRSAVQGHEGGRIVFLGDYVDPYPQEGIDQKAAFQELLDIIALKRAKPSNVVLLLGNHDLGYLDSEICTCRMDWEREKEIRQTFLDNLDLFDLIHIECTSEGNILFSHAGISEQWVKKNKSLFDVGVFNPLKLNEMLHDANARPGLFKALSCVSWYRGGLDKFGSPIWADVNEFLSGNRFIGGYFHVFGHTLHDGGPINVRGRGLCLDCAQAFALT